VAHARPQLLQAASFEAQTLVVDAAAVAYAPVGVVVMPEPPLSPVLSPVSSPVSSPESSPEELPDEGFGVSVK